MRLAWRKSSASGKVLIPPSPGVFSAFGLLRAEVEHHAARTVLTTSEFDLEAVLFRTEAEGPGPRGAHTENYNTIL